ncbi:hypothetical protein [Ktedonospora formicarum]|uniref:hypothetical protein n=1 Tax=Ktedonospora formicarum TaxID=2778364 RepID=UPI001C68B1AD|nr:hypothetical protein [Ktedonospora formicarum]
MSKEQAIILKCNKGMANWGKHYLQEHGCILDAKPTHHDLLTCPQGTTVERAGRYQTLEPRYRYTLPDGAWFVGQYLRARANEHETGNYILFLPEYAASTQRKEQR